MDINKIENRVNGNNFNKTDATSKGKEASGSSSTADSPRDKVSLSDYAFRNNDQLFAKLELGKLNDSSSNQLQKIKAQLTEYKEAAEISSEAAEKTEMGQKINDPSVWGDIANKILQ